MKFLTATATFGCLSRATLTFHDGLNTLTLPNEGGKSTWCVFLPTMLYGFPPRARDKRGEPAAKNRYRPRSGAAMEGLLTLEQAGRVLTLRRSSKGATLFGKFSAVYDDTGEPVPGLTGENCGELLCGVTREVFERTLLIRQTNLAVAQSPELEQRIASLLTTGEEGASFSEVEGRLRAWQRERRYHNSGTLPKLEAEDARLAGRLASLSGVWREYQGLEEELGSLRSALTEAENRSAGQAAAEIAELEERRRETLAELEEAERHVGDLEAASEDENDYVMADLEHDIALLDRARKVRTRGFLVFCAAALALALLLAASSLLPERFPTVSSSNLAAVLLALAFTAVIWFLFRWRGDKRDAADMEELEAILETRRATQGHDDTTLQAAYARQRAARQVLDLLASSRESLEAAVSSPEMQEIQRKLHQTESRLALLTGRLAELGDPAALEAEREGLQEQQAQGELEYGALTLALETLSAAEREMRAHFSPRLNRETTEIFTALTGGKYGRVTLDRSFAAETEETGSTILYSADYLSQGAADQLYLALRLALCRLVLPPETNSPLLLDDALATFDSARADLARRVLEDCADAAQVLLFTRT
jgi:uncharacterized protein YhaN